jgi:CHASE2 domain-containing sensor protein
LTLLFYFLWLFSLLEVLVSERSRRVFLLLEVCFLGLIILLFVAMVLFMRGLVDKLLLLVVVLSGSPNQLARVI